LVNGTLSIVKAPLTITAEDKQMYEGDKLPTFTASYTGFKNGNSEYSLTKKPDFLCDATSSSSPGTYDIIPCNAESKNYDISYVKGKLTIDSVITVRVKDCSREYGEENPVFEYSVEGGTLEGEPSFNCNAYSWSEVGTYEIKIQKGNIKNPKVNLINGVLTITKAPLIISVGDYEVKVGKPLPKFTVSYSGFKRSDNQNDLTKQPVTKCDASELSEPGEYEIVVSGAEAKNYEMLYQNGMLTILPKIFAVVANPIAGGLDGKISEFGFPKQFIDGLTISGELNSTDIKTIREMQESGDLSHLDLHGSSIIVGGEPYYLEYTTRDDVIGKYFFNSKRLEGVFLPDSVTTIESDAFYNCHSLRCISIPSTVKIIENNSLSGCNSIDTIFCYVKDISHVRPYQKRGNVDDLNAFDKISNNCIWHVVMGTSDQYIHLNWWKKTWKIIDDLVDRV
jgi:hypothetical protein